MYFALCISWTRYAEKFLNIYGSKPLNESTLFDSEWLYPTHFPRSKIVQSSCFYFTLFHFIEKKKKKLQRSFSTNILG